MRGRRVVAAAITVFVFAPAWAEWLAYNAEAAHAYVALWAVLCVAVLVTVAHPSPAATRREPQTYVGEDPPPCGRPGDVYVSMTTGLRYRRTRRGKWNPEKRRAHGR
jgi:hypothetical protein